METNERARTLGDYTRLLRRRWQYLVTIIPGALLFSIFLAYVLPVSYRATGTLILEASSLPADMVPTTVTGREDITQYAGQQIELARRRVMTNENLEEIVKKIDPYPDQPELSIRQKASMIGSNSSVEAVDPITLQPSPTSTAFSIHYENPDPEIALAVNRELVDLFLTYNRRTRAEQAAEAHRFLQAQAAELERTMLSMEKQLAQFKAKYGDALPQAEGRNLAGLDRARRDLETLERNIAIAEEREALLALQLSELSPSLTAAVGDWRMELAKLRAELALAEQRYTEEHPDVKRLRRAISDLAAQGAASSKAAGQPDNPEYLRVQSQLASARRELATLRAAAERARNELANYEQNLATTPQVEQQYIQLSREYENAQTRYADLQQKIRAAALAQSLESEARGERFGLMKASSVPSTPYSPNRLGIILLGIVLGGGIAIAVAVLVDASDPTVRSSDDLREVLQMEPVSAVPLIMNPMDIRRRRIVWGSVSATYIAAAGLVAMVVTNAK